MNFAVSPPRVTSIGPPPERHAARVVGEMCQWLAAERERLDRQVYESLERTRSRLGSPKAQMRFCARLAKEAGKAFIEVNLQGGKRGKFIISLVEWGVVAPMTCRPLEPDEPLPERPWLTCDVVILHGPGVRNKAGAHEASKHYRAFALTHHAMQRLAERHQAREPDHLLAALFEIWQRVSDAIARGAARETKEWHLPLPTTGGVAIVEKNPDLGLIVKTVLE